MQKPLRKTEPTQPPRKLKHPPNDRRSRRKRERKAFMLKLEKQEERMRRLARELGAKYI